jgi:uncharacterized protein (TIGR02611 family)
MRRRIKKTFVTVVGTIVLIAGIIMIPYPGPGWLTVFAGLGILSTEYVWAKRLLRFAKTKYDAWAEWVAHQNKYIKAALWIATAVVVVLTLWLLNAYGIINDVLNWEFDWARSPLPIFH